MGPTARVAVSSDFPQRVRRLPQAVQNRVYAMCSFTGQVLKRHGYYLDDYFEPVTGGVRGYTTTSQVAGPWICGAARMWLSSSLDGSSLAAASAAVSYNWGARSRWRRASPSRARRKVLVVYRVTPR